MESLSVAFTPPPPAEPQLGYLVGGFLLLVAGLAALTLGRRPASERERPSATRALLYIAVYALCSACFMRVIGPAVMGWERSPWLLALGDVIFVTLGLFVWVMVLAEARKPADFGFRGGSAGRLPLAVIMAIGAVAAVSFDSYYALMTGQVIANPDSLVFATLFALVGSALPEEILFRGYLMSALDGRTQRWGRVVIAAAAFTLVRAVKLPPGVGLGSMEGMVYIFGAVLPLGLWWGLMRELAGGSIWPGLASHFFVEFGTTLARTSQTPA